MPTVNPRVQVTFDPVIYDRIVKLAAAERRSLSNFVEHHLLRVLDTQLASVSKSGQIDIEEQIKLSDLVKPRPTGGMRLSDLARPSKHK